MRKPLNQKLWLGVLLCLIGNHPIFSQFVGSTYAEARKTKTATFYYIYDEVYGLTGTDGSGNVTGLLADMMSEFEAFLLKEEGIEVNSEYVLQQNFDVFLENVKFGKGAVFGLSNISINEERKKYYDFSPPYLENVSMVLTNSKTPALQNISEIGSTFEGMTAYTLSQSTYHKRLLEIKQEYFPSMEIVEATSIPPIMEQLINNSKAFAVLDLNVYIEILQKKLPVKRHAVADQKGDQFGLIMPKGSDWEPSMRKFLTQFRGSNAYGKIITENLGASALRLINSMSN